MYKTQIYIVKENREMNNNKRKIKLNRALWNISWLFECWSVSEKCFVASPMSRWEMFAIENTNTHKPQSSLWIVSLDCEFHCESHWFDNFCIVQQLIRVLGMLIDACAIVFPTFIDTKLSITTKNLLTTTKRNFLSLNIFSHRKSQHEAEQQKKWETKNIFMLWR